jgi:hypothetical protein
MALLKPCELSVCSLVQALLLTGVPAAESKCRCCPVFLQGLAFAEKTESRASKQLKKQAVATLKTLY